MAKTQQIAARCWYCDARGVSNEHVLAKSLAKLFPGHGAFRLNYEHPELGVRRAPKRAPTFMIKSRKFCHRCNSGWMNQIDQAVRRVLHCFALDAPTVLDGDDQRQLARWAAKTVLGLLSIEPEGFRFADRGLYHELHRTGQPPSRLQLWVGANVHGDVAWNRSHTLFFPELGDDARGFGSTLSFGYVVLHLIQHADDDVLLSLRYDPHRALRQIWPIEESEVRWPPPLRLQPRDLSALAIEIGRHSIMVPRTSASLLSVEPIRRRRRRK